MTTLSKQITTVRLKGGTTYSGLYRIKVTHLPISAAANAMLFVISGVFFALTMLVWHGPFWAQLATGYWAASFFIALVKEVWFIVLKSGADG